MANPDVSPNGRGPVSAVELAKLGARMAVRGMTTAKVHEVTAAIQVAAYEAAVSSTAATLAAVAEAHDANLLNLAQAIRDLPGAPTPTLREAWNGTSNRAGYVSREQVLRLVEQLQAVRS
jgi:hypothetical protein